MLNGEFARDGTQWRLTALIGTVVSLVHASALWFLTHAVAWRVHAARSEESMSVVEITPSRVATAIRPTQIAPLKIARLSLLSLRLPALGDLAQEAPPAPEEPHPTGAITPPHPADGVQPDTTLFADRAGVTVGTGATIVLRIEVRGDGTVGRTVVDVSSGHRRIDGQAIAYVHAMRWVGGRVGERPASLWIRWGVRLQVPMGTIGLRQGASRIGVVPEGREGT